MTNKLMMHLTKVNAIIKIVITTMNQWMQMMSMPDIFPLRPRCADQYTTKCTLAILAYNCRLLG